MCIRDRVTIYTEPNHPSPIYHVDGSIEPNPYGDLAVLLEDDNLEEVMYNGGTQCVKVAHRNHGMCRTNVWIDDDSGIQIAKNIINDNKGLDFKNFDKISDQLTILAVNESIKIIKSNLKNIGIVHDKFQSEREIVNNNEVQKTVDKLIKKKFVY